jgi:mono/diheme cytochrome c family protein
MKKSIVFVIVAAMMVIALPAMADAGPDGAALYKGKCASCHGADGSGQTPVGKSMKLRDLRSEEVQKQDAKALFTIIADGKGKMPAYKAKLSTADIDALVSFIKSLKK